MIVARIKLPNWRLNETVDLMFEGQCYRPALVDDYPLELTEALYESGMIRLADGSEPRPGGGPIVLRLTDRGRQRALASRSSGKNKARRPESAHLARQGTPGPRDHRQTHRN